MVIIEIAGLRSVVASKTIRFDFVRRRENAYEIIIISFEERERDQIIQICFI